MYTVFDESSRVLITGNHPFLEEPAEKAVGKPTPVAGDRYAWTDVSGNLLRVIKWEGAYEIHFPHFAWRNANLW